MSALAAIGLALTSAVAGPAAETRLPPCLAGIYDGSAPEIGAGIELRSDGRFRYGMAYGALDEGADGTWSADDEAVYLTSDPVVAPRFALVSDVANADGVVRIRLDLPRGLSPQYFAVSAAYGDGAHTGRQFTDDAVEFPAGDAGLPRQVRVFLPVFDLTSEAVPVTQEAGRDLTVRFEPNDLGSVAFERTPMARRDGELVLERHGRTLRFRQTSGACMRRTN